MKIPDKAQLVAEMRRVLRPGALLAIYVVCAGPGGPPHFPVPCTRDPSISCPIAPEELRGLLQAPGFENLRWRDTTEVAPAWYRTLACLMLPGRTSAAAVSPAPGSGPLDYAGEPDTQPCGAPDHTDRDGGSAALIGRGDRLGLGVHGCEPTLAGYVLTRWREARVAGDGARHARRALWVNLHVVGRAITPLALSRG